jgi:methylamine dehydrogenase accessory protein MauD
METLLLVSYAVLWLLVLVLGFLFIGILRAYGILKWRFEELEATTPNRVGRSGLKPGKQAPNFTLPQVGGGERSLTDFAGRPLLLMFVQEGCGPCHAIAPLLNELARKRDLQVAAVNSSSREAAHAWAEDVKAEFPVLIQERWRVSKSFEVYATPFAFLIGADGKVQSCGIAGSRQHLGYVLSGAGRTAVDDHADSRHSRPVETNFDQADHSTETANV